MIGLFDSGIGGLAILREVRRLLPEADLTYVADQGNAPYGERSLDEVRRLADRVAGYLIEHGADPVVVACNTASAAALRQLRASHPGTPFVGMEPAVKPAAAATSSGVVGVLATEATFQGELFADLMARHGNGVTVLTRACPGLAARVENHPADDPATIRLLTGFSTPLVEAGADAVVLGCTHYSFLSGALVTALGPGVAILDPAAAVARQVARLAPGGGSGTTRYLTTADPDRFTAQVAALLDEQVAAEHLDPSKRWVTPEAAATVGA